MLPNATLVLTHFDKIIQPSQNFQAIVKSIQGLRDKFHGFLEFYPWSIFTVMRDHIFIVICTSYQDYYYLLFHTKKVLLLSIGRKLWIMESMKSTRNGFIYRKDLEKVLKESFQSQIPGMSSKVFWEFGGERFNEDDAKARTLLWTRFEWSKIRHFSSFISRGRETKTPKVAAQFDWLFVRRTTPWMRWFKLHVSDSWLLSSITGKPNASFLPYVNSLLFIDKRLYSWYLLGNRM